MSRNASSSGAPSSSTARIAAMRPRGESRSRPVTRYVGQCGRHSPHATQATSSSSSTGSMPARSRGRGRRVDGQSSVGAAGCARASTCRSGSNAVRDPRCDRRGVRAARDAEAVETGRTRFAQQPTAGRLGRGAARRQRRARRRRRRARCRRRPRPASGRRRRVSSGASVAERRGRTEIRPRCGPVGPRRAPRCDRPARRSARARRRRRPRPFEQHVRVRAVPREARRPVQVARRSANGSASVVNHSRRRGRGWHRSVTCTSTPIVPSEPTSSRGRS